MYLAKPLGDGGAYRPFCRDVTSSFFSRPLMLQCCFCLSVCRLSKTYSSIRTQPIRSRKYEESIGAKINDRDLCIEVVYGHVNHCFT